MSFDRSRPPQSFDQDLNTTDSPTFDGLTVSTTAPSGAGITALFASPPALGSTTPAAVSGTTGSFSGAVTTNNATPFRSKDSGGVARALVQLFSDDYAYLDGKAGIKLRPNGSSEVFVLTPTSLTLSNIDLILATAGKLVDLSAGGFVKHSVTGSITAGTTQTQAGATALTTEQNYIATCANVNDGVKLPTAQSGLEIHIRNNGANAAQVWPASGDAIDGGAADAVDPNTLASGASRVYVALDGTNWYADGNS